MNILITGIAGFVGSHLAEYVSAALPKVVIHGTRRPKGSAENISNLVDKIKLHDVDITDAASVFRLLDAVRPEQIYHLAAQSYVRTSWESPQETLKTNVIGQTNILEALRQLKSDHYNPIIVIAGSSEEYGNRQWQHIPFKEDTPLQPFSPYAVSKIGQDFLGFQYWQSYQLRAIRLRIFNHTGPRRPTTFGDSHLAHQIALIEKGLAKPEVTYRDLNAVRDFTDVRDVVRAYVLAARRCQPGEVYNVCSGQGISIGQIYDKLISLSTVRNIRLVPDPQGPRPTDGGTIIGDFSRFAQSTGWKPEMSFLNQTLPDLLNFWRKTLNV